MLCTLPEKQVDAFPEMSAEGAPVDSYTEFSALVSTL